MIVVPSATRLINSARSLRLECSYGRGFAGMYLLGNASEACRDGKERVRAAWEAQGLLLPAKRIVFNLSPGDIKVEGTQVDLAFAVAMLSLARPEAVRRDIRTCVFAGEVGLDGSIKATRSLVSYALAAAREGFKGMVVSERAGQVLRKLLASSSHLSSSLEIVGIADLASLQLWLSGLSIDTFADASAHSESSSQTPLNTGPNFDDMMLSPEQSRAAQVCAIGQHSMLIQGVPGTGKSMFAQRIPSIFPELRDRLHLEVLDIHNAIREALPPELLRGQVPFRSPHHSASASAILGNMDHPGEVSLAHGGILFLDELAEYRRDVLESLREPLETGLIHLARAQKRASWKAEFLLLAATNRCPCGWYGSRKRLCHCPTSKVQAYQRRLSGALLDRIDIHLTFPEDSGEHSLIYDETETHRLGSPTTRLSQAVAVARALAIDRNQRWGVLANARLNMPQLIQCSGFSGDQIKEMLRRDNRSQQLSNRSLLRVLRLARSLADLEGRSKVIMQDIHQALAWQPSAEPGSTAATSLTASNKQNSAIKFLNAGLS